MTQTESGPRDNSGRALAARLAWLLLILATLYICYFHNLGAIGLVGPDEPRYAWIARDMAETGDWVTPRLYGKPWFEKPALYYWGAALCFKLFGVSEVAARLPSALSALLATLAMAWLAWRVYGAETARWVLLLLPTTVGMIGFSHAAAPDMPFAAMLTVAMVFAAKLVGLMKDRECEVAEVNEVQEVKETEKTPSLQRLKHGRTFPSFTSFTSLTSFTSFFFGVFLGLAVLAKGPAAIILAGGGILLWALFTKRWRDALRCLHPIGIVSFCLTALPWYVLCALRNPDFFRVFIIEHNFRRYLTPEFQHIQPFWFYIPILLIAFIPWTFVLLWSAGYGALSSWREKRLSPVASFFLSWVVFCILFFSASQSKLPGYILPTVPTIGLFVVRSHVSVAPQVQRALRWQIVAWSSLALIASIALALIGFGCKFPRSPTKEALLAAGAGLLLLSVANFLLAGRSLAKKAKFDLAVLCVIPVILIPLSFHTFSEPWLRWDPSGKTLASEIVAERIPLDRVYVRGMPRGQHFSLNFYLHSEVTDWSDGSPREGYLLLGGKYCRGIVRPPFSCTVTPNKPEQSGWFINRVERVGQ